MDEIICFYLGWKGTSPLARFMAGERKGRLLAEETGARARKRIQTNSGMARRRNNGRAYLRASCLPAWYRLTYCFRSHFDLSTTSRTAFIELAAVSLLTAWYLFYRPSCLPFHLLHCFKDMPAWSLECYLYVSLSSIYIYLPGNRWLTCKRLLAFLFTPFPCLRERG